MNVLPKWLVVTLGLLLSILLITVSINQIGVFTARMKPGADNRTLTISASGKVTAVPDMATIQSSVIVEGSSAQEVKDKAAKKMNETLAAVKAFGVKQSDLQTSNYYVQPKYKFKPGEGSEIVGYTASESLTIKVRDNEKIGSVINILTEKGLNQIGQVQYSFEDPDKYKQQAREKALANAKEKAEKLASVAGVRLGRVVSFHEQQYPEQPIPYSDLAKAPAAEVRQIAPQFEPGTNEISAVVSVTYELR